MRSRPPVFKTLCLNKHLKACRQETSRFHQFSPLLLRATLKHIEMSFYFAIVGTKDNPIYEAEFGTSKQGGDGVARFREEQRSMNQFIVHSSLDIVEEVQWATPTMYMKCVDKFNNLQVSCFLTAGNIKFLLLHDQKADDAIRQFFTDVYDLYTKTLMNPFYEVDMRITSGVFDGKVKQAAKKYL